MNELQVLGTTRLAVVAFAISWEQDQPGPVVRVRGGIRSGEEVRGVDELADAVSVCTDEGDESERMADDAGDDARWEGEARGRVGGGTVRLPPVTVAEGYGDCDGKAQ